MLRSSPVTSPLNKPAACITCGAFGAFGNQSSPDVTVIVELRASPLHTRYLLPEAVQGVCFLQGGLLLLHLLLRVHHRLRHRRVAPALRRRLVRLVPTHETGVTESGGHRRHRTQQVRVGAECALPGMCFVLPDNVCQRDVEREDPYSSMWWTSPEGFFVTLTSGMSNPKTRWGDGVWVSGGGYT
eukprot:138768-Prorocentrum_minimum.AAC.6